VHATNGNRAVLTRRQNPNFLCLRETRCHRERRTQNGKSNRCQSHLTSALVKPGKHLPSSL
jgi:hypothetical protein